jgi:hypothetical protein
MTTYHARQFSAVQRKWTAIARHTMKDTHPVVVCACPILLEALPDTHDQLFRDVISEAMMRCDNLQQQRLIRLSAMHCAQSSWRLST